VNPKVREYWEKALDSLRTAKTLLENGEVDSIVKKELCSALVYGHLMTREFGGGFASAGILDEHLHEIQSLGCIQAIDITLRALKEYWRLVPDEYYLPEPTI
jgi:hypothetical protein